MSILKNNGKLNDNDNFEEKKNLVPFRQASSAAFNLTVCLVVGQSGSPSTPRVRVREVGERGVTTRCRAAAGGLAPLVRTCSTLLAAPAPVCWISGKKLINK